MVHTSIDPARDAEFNEWYNTEHVHDVLRAPGAISARRYRKIQGSNPHQYLAVYEWDSQASLDAFHSSDYRQQVWKRHQELFLPFPEPDRADYQLIYPS
jgi:heme-degrading monooxygenase HmoA